MSVYVCVCVLVSLHVSVYAHMVACKLVYEGQRSTLNAISQESSILFSETECLTGLWPANFPRLSDQWLLGTSLSLLSSVGIKSVPHHACLFNMGLRDGNWVLMWQELYRLDCLPSSFQEFLIMASTRPFKFLIKCMLSPLEGTERGGGNKKEESCSNGAYVS